MARRHPKLDAGEPGIGIWWDDGNVCVALREPIASGTPQGDWIDSNLEHHKVWPQVAHRFGRSPRDDYFEVPRGRVLWNSKTSVARIYHGNSTSRLRLKLIAAEFGLTRWASRTDPHYMLGSDADDLLSE